MINFSALRPETLPGRIVRLPFRLLPSELALPVLQGPLRGRKWIVGAHLHGCWLGSYEWEMQNRIARELGPRSVFYDVGANAGFYSLLGSLCAGPAGRVYAFEPLPANLAFLRRHLELNGARNVTVLELALSDEVGTASFVCETTRAMGKLEAGGGLTVATSTLDSLLAAGRIAPPDCVKMDIEGGEFRALLGAASCFQQFRPKLFLATHGRRIHEECCRLLRCWGYQWSYTARASAERAELFARPAGAGHTGAR